MTKNANNDSFDDEDPERWQESPDELRVRDLIDNLDTSDDHYVYDVDGLCLFEARSEDADSGDAPDFLDHFHGPVSDADVGMFYDRARHFDPRIGVLLSAESLAADTNVYRHVSNQPAEAADPTESLPTRE